MGSWSVRQLVSPLPPPFHSVPPSLCVGSVVPRHELAASGGEQADQLPELVLEGTRHHGLPGRDLGFHLLQGGQGGGGQPGEVGVDGEEWDSQQGLLLLRDRGTCLIIAFRGSLLYALLRVHSTQ